MNPKTKKQSWLILAGVIALAVIALTLVLTSWNRQNADANSVTAEQTPAPAKKGTFRLLVAGSDRTTGLADVMMLLSLDRDTGETWILQIPRDTYAVYTDGSYRKINGAPRSLGGMAELRDFLSAALGVTIDRYVRLSPDAFREAVDALGGVEIDLEEPMDYEDPAQGLSIHLPEGKQTLDGAAAEEFVRYRSGYIRGDLGRMDAQKIFLSALFRTARNSASPLTLVKLATVLLDGLETDLTVSDAVMLGGEALSVRAEQVYFVTAPGTDATAKSGASYYVLSASGMAELLTTHFGADENGFDPEEVFLNRNNEKFGEIYRGYTPYVTYSAAEIQSNGIGIGRIDE